MARWNLKVIVAYIAFVGFPVLGLLGILRIGRDLTAPVSVAGLWKVTINVDQSASCMREIASLQENSISIVQSGHSLVLTIGKGKEISAAGTIAGTEVTATLIVATTLTRERPSDGTLVINARVDSHAQPRTLEGTISPAQGTSCTPVSFHATRLSILN